LQSSVAATSVAQAMAARTSPSPVSADIEYSTPAAKPANASKTARR